MKKYVTNYVATRPQMSLDRGMLERNGFIICQNRIPPPQDGWLLSWGFPFRKHNNAVIEGGFFWDAAVIDSRGIFASSSLNLSETIERMRTFKAPRHAEDIIFNDALYFSKIKQPEEQHLWDGVVLPLQVTSDRSLENIGKQHAYLAFLEGACKHYGKRLLLKIHPRQEQRDIRRARELANTHGCKIVRSDLSVLKSCRFVLVYCSGFAMDCFLRDVPVAQFAPGFWYKTGAVTYTDGQYPDDVEDTIDMAHRVADWAIWKYCFHWCCPESRWVALLNLFAESKELFPLPEEFSYAACHSYESKKK